MFKTDAKGSADGSHSLEFDIAGNHVKLALGKNGEVELNTSDGSGDKKSYSMKLDEHGLPVITSTDGDTSDKGQGDKGQPGADSQNAGNATDNGQKPGGPGGGHTPDTSGVGDQQPSSNVSVPTTGGDADKDKKPPAPAPQQPQPPQQPNPPTEGFDSGAELAEAGPL